MPTDGPVRSAENEGEDDDAPRDRDRLLQRRAHDVLEDDVARFALRRPPARPLTTPACSGCLGA
jgi:hypothetical protein